MSLLLKKITRLFSIIIIWLALFTPLAASHTITGGIEVTSQIAQGAKCIVWESVALSAAASISPAGRLGYKATLLKNKKLANRMDGDGAFNLRTKIKKDFRLFKPIDNLLKKRDYPRDKIRDPVDSFAALRI